MNSHNNKNLVVYKASAGSGKTFTLAIEFLELLMNDVYAYRKTLAVTFTNKATAEMKSRILSQLYGLAHDLPSSAAYKDVLQKRNPSLTDKHIKEYAQKALRAIIHDYSRFRVETIDSFFQRVTKQLAHELKLSANFNIELDNTLALEEAVDIILEKLHNDKDLFNVVMSYIEEKLADNKKWKVDSEIKNFARHIFDEKYAKDGSKPSFAAINQYKQYLYQKQQQAHTTMDNYVKGFHNILNKHGAQINDFTRGEKGPCNFFLKLAKHTYETEDFNKKTYLEAQNDYKKFLKKDSPAAAESAAPELQQLMINAEKERAIILKEINTINLTLKDLNNISLFGSIAKILHEENENKNRFLLSDTNKLLSDMIGDDDPSFIYEKIGTLIEHIMIDEFQDTSSMQWENFSKLLKNGLANGEKSLIVGDVKQSIYRWRGGDWNILNTRLKNDIKPYEIDEQTLDTNRRSASNIISFNNAFFTEIINSNDNDNELGDIESLRQAYSDVVQNIPEGKKSNSGYVKVIELKKQSENEESPEEKDKYSSEEYKNDTIESLAREIKDLIDKGLSMNDICILLRSKTPMQDIVKYFANELPDIKLVSEEAFRLDSSEAIITIISALKYLDSTEDKVARVQMAMFFNQETPINTLLTESRRLDKDFDSKYLPAEFTDRFEELRSMPLYELVENLMRIFGVYEKSNEQTHICFFLDALKKFMQEQNPDIETFINYWDDNLSSQSIPGGSADGVKIMTIHKSKGLQAHTILIPFCDWELVTTDYKKAPIVWCQQPQSFASNNIGILPIKFSQKMQESEFEAEFQEEKTQMIVDNINLLYVAFTRAEKNLIVFTRTPQKDNSYGTVGKILLEALPKIAQKYNLKSELPEWEFGEKITDSNKRSNSEEDNPLARIPQPIEVEFKHTNAKVEFRQSNKSVKFQNGEETEQQEYINKGILMHSLFSNLRQGSEAEIEKALNDMEKEGLIADLSEKKKMHDLALRRMEQLKYKEWFAQDNRLYNECKLIYRNSDGEFEQCQPDRVIVNGNNITVVDFKFGKQKEEYVQQVKNYIDLLSQTKFKGVDSSRQTVKGYIWYVYNNNVIEVE